MASDSSALLLLSIQQLDGNGLAAHWSSFRFILGCSRINPNPFEAVGSCLLAAKLDLSKAVFPPNIPHRFVLPFSKRYFLVAPGMRQNGVRWRLLI